MAPLLLALLAAEPDAALLEHLAAHEARLDAQLKQASFKMTISADELDGDGKSEHHNETVMRMKIKDGKTTPEVVKVIEDGEDVTERDRKKVAEGNDDADSKKEKEKGKNGGVSFGAASPFGKEVQAKYEFALLAPSAAQPNLVRMSFRPKGDKVPELAQGDALVDPQSGEVVHLSMRPSKLPPFVDHLLIDIDYGAATPAGRCMSHVDIRGDGGLLFIHKRFRADTRFSEYVVETARAPTAP